MLLAPRYCSVIGCRPAENRPLGVWLTAPLVTVRPTLPPPGHAPALSTRVAVPPTVAGPVTVPLKVTAVPYTMGVNGAEVTLLVVFPLTDMVIGFPVTGTDSRKER